MLDETVVNEAVVQADDTGSENADFGLSSTMFHKMKLGQAKEWLEPWGLLQKGSLLEFLMGFLCELENLRLEHEEEMYSSLFWMESSGVCG